MNLSGYKLTSKKHGGQYSGPCWYTGLGTDRFTIEPYNPYGPSWFCRNCSSSCSRGYAGRAGYRYGSFNADDRPSMDNINPKKEVDSRVSLNTALRFAGSMNQEGMAYLESRGINLATVNRFHLGMVAGKMITIPLVYEWQRETQCVAIKRRWLPQYQPQNRPRYMAMPGSKSKGVFNFDVLRQPGDFGIIANSLFDVMLLDQLGYRVVGPFTGEADWLPKWSGHIQWRTIINMGDWDAEHEGRDGPYRPGTEYMLQRAIKLSYAQNVRRIINTYPPDGIEDITAAWQAGVNLNDWINSLMEV